jgi:hypothetical protein
MKQGKRWAWVGLAFSLVAVPPARAQQLPPAFGGAGVPEARTLPAVPPPVLAPAPEDRGPALQVPESDAPPPAEAGEAKEHPGAFLLGADYLLLKPRRMLDYAINGPSSPWGPQGGVDRLQADYTSGFRASAGYRLPGCGADVSFAYTYLFSSTDGGQQRPPDNTLFATLTHPGTVSQVDSARANARLDYQVFDLEVGHWFKQEALSYRLFGGARLAKINQDFNVFYDGRDAQGGDTVLTRFKFNGGGVRGGGEAVWDVYHGLGFYGRGAVSLLAGQFRAGVAEVSAGATGPLVNVTDDYRKIVPVVEMGVGVVWQSEHWRITAGYEFVNWFNLIDMPDFVDDVHQGKYARRISDLGLDGLVLRAELTY